MAEQTQQHRYEPADIMGGLYGDGIIGLKGAFSREWVARMREDIETLFAEARKVEGGALPRGPERWYVEVHPERVRGFVDIATHPWFVAVCETVLGPDYRIVEVGFDIPFPGAADQPWHRDFVVPDATTKGRRLNSLAFNLTAVDTVPEMGPFEIALGTQWDQFEGCPRGMFPPREHWARYVARAVPKMPKMGDISARSALTIHRGTPNRTDTPRPMVVMGYVMHWLHTPNVDLTFPRGYHESLPEPTRRRLRCQVVDELPAERVETYLEFKH